MRIYLFLLILLVVRFGWAHLSPAKYSPGNVVKTVAVLSREPEVAYGRQIVRVEGLIVYAPMVPDLHFGDRVEIAGLVSEHLVISKPTVRIIDQNASNWWNAAAFTIRSRFMETYQSILNRNQANLLSGIVLGNLGLNRQFKDKLANVGLTHVVAASGMNISLFSGFVFWLCSMLQMRLKYKALLTTILILFYSTITGFEPPIVRAAIMALFSLLGMLLGRQKSGLLGLSMSAYVMLWVDPTLLSNAGFLLSFSAMTGQIILGGFTIQLPKGKGPITTILSFLSKDVVASLAAILATFPIVMMFFAKFSLVSLFTNAVVLWSVEPLMILGAVAGIIGMISVELARVVALPASLLLSFFLWVVDVFGRDTRFLLQMAGIDWMFAFGYYLVLGAAVWWWRDRHVGVYYKP